MSLENQNSNNIIEHLMGMPCASSLTVNLLTSESPVRVYGRDFRNPYQAVSVQFKDETKTFKDQPWVVINEEYLVVVTRESREESTFMERYDLKDVKGWVGLRKKEDPDMYATDCMVNMFNFNSSL